MVKGRASLRAEQAERTRHRILRAAGEVFAEQGFVGARIEDVAARAGVAVPTVYKVFTNKRNLLVGALNVALTGGDDAPVDRQPWFTEQLEQPDPVEQVDLIARNARQIYDRAGAILEAVRAGATHDEDLAHAWDRINADRLARSKKSARHLIATAGRRPGMTADDVAVTLLVLTQPELYTAHLAAGRTAHQYESWLARVLRSTLLGDAA